MASPQTEHGFTRIANELLENIPYFKFNGTQLRLLLTVWRFTYGFSRKSHEMSLIFLANATGLKKTHVKKELDTLIEANVITIVREASFNSTREISFNKDYDEWRIEISNAGSIQYCNCSTVSQKGDTQYCSSSTPKNNEKTGKVVTNPNGKAISNGGYCRSSTVPPLEHQERKIKKTLKKDNVYTSDFEKFYTLYPRPEGKRRTFNNWRTCLKSNTADELITAAKNYTADKIGTERQFLKTSANFLGREKPFEDYLPQNYQGPPEQKENFGINLRPEEKYFD